MKEQLFYQQPTLPTASPEQGAKAPKRVGPYVVESLLTHGGMSSLYLAKEAQSGQVVAIKTLASSFVENKEMVNQFLEEAKIISIADHPNIIKLFGQGKWEGGLYIAMEFVQGVSLKQFIDQHSLSLKRCVDIALQVAYALLHLHTHDIVHRDLKPENILITESGQVKVIDFGVAQLRNSGSKKMRGGTIGTPSYMAPEQIKDPMQATYASDIYALGVIMYEMVTGKLSYGNIQLSYLPKNIKPLLEKALASSLDQRYIDVVDVITDISEYSKGLLSQDETDEGGASHAELLETLLEAQKQFSTLKVPQWDHMDMALAMTSNEQALGTSYDFYRLANGNYLIMTIEAISDQVDAALYIAYFKGMLGPLVSQYSVMSSVFEIDAFASTLNNALCSDQENLRFKMNILYLDQEEDTYQFLSCGYHSLWHLTPQMAQPKLVTSENPPMGGKRGQEFSHTSDSWYVEDILLFHTCNSSQLPIEKQQRISEQAKALISEHSNLAAPSFAKALLDGLLPSLDPSISKEKRSSLVIQRI